MQSHGTDDREITAYVDIEAPPPGQSAFFLFGTNQASPVDIAVEHYHRGLAPMIIVTGGVNRHTGVIEGQQFRRLLIQRDILATDIRCEDRSTNTWENVAFAGPWLAEASASGLPVTIVAKWYHLRAVHAMSRQLGGKVFYGLGWDPAYDGRPVTRSSWPQHPSGRRRVLREWDEVRRKIAAGELERVERRGGWRVGD